MYSLIYVHLEYHILSSNIYILINILIIHFAIYDIFSNMTTKSDYKIVIIGESKLSYFINKAWWVRPLFFCVISKENLSK